MTKNKTRIIVFVLIVIVLVSALVIAIRMNQPHQNKTARIYQNGELIKEINLDKITEPIEFNITDDNGHTNTVRAENGRICMISADCPDKICVNQGWIDNGVIPIVCLPNKVTVEIVGTTDDVDAMAGGV